MLFEQAHRHRARGPGRARAGRLRDRRGVRDRTGIAPFGGIKDSGLGYKEGVVEAMKSYTNVKTFSLPWT
ncbi:MAG TPA: aldehyde dehydrogenase family protein [Thermohalobaculum sp.]|nr:aldehyde dehydrogenase family protein [Thermohalobaculum sp.]